MSEDEALSLSSNRASGPATPPYLPPTPELGIEDGNSEVDSPPTTPVSTKAAKNHTTKPVFKHDSPAKKRQKQESKRKVHAKEANESRSTSFAARQDRILTSAELIQACKRPLAELYLAPAPMGEEIAMKLWQRRADDSEATKLRLHALLLEEQIHKLEGKYLHSVAGEPSLLNGWGCYLKELGCYDGLQELDEAEQRQFTHSSATSEAALAALEVLKFDEIDPLDSPALPSLSVPIAPTSPTHQPVRARTQRRRGLPAPPARTNPPRAVSARQTKIESFLSKAPPLSPIDEAHWKYDSNED